MTRKIAISLPDDVAERLAQESNVSAYVTESVRRRMAHERSLELLRAAGYELNPSDLAAADERLDRARSAMTPELRAEAARLLAEGRRR